MFKRSLVATATLTLLCSYAAAADQPSSSTDEPLPLAELSAITAVPAPVTSLGSTLAKATPSAAETTARRLQTGFTAINKPYANQLGTGNGAGVVVGIVDSGVQVNHPELNGRIKSTYNAFTGGTDATDQMGHGTHVSGLIAGKLQNGAPVEGIAPGALLVVAKAFTTGGSDSLTIGKGIHWVVNAQKAPILSLSLGAGALALEVPIRNAVAKGTLVTAALGNEGKTTAASWPAEFAKQPWANGQIIAVGAVDANNKRASFSNYDPTLANWTDYAPGVNVASSYSNSTTKTVNSYAYMSGTSMATPIVAGQAALIKGNWAFLPATSIAQIIFKSATHLCNDVVSATVCAARTLADPVYGWGLINVGASLQPVGGLNLGIRSGAAVNLAGTTLSSGRSGLASGLSGVNAIAVDQFNRGFVVNVPSLALASVSGVLSSTPAAVAYASSANGSKISLSYATQATYQSAMGLSAPAGTLTFAKSSANLALSKGSSVGFGVGGSESAFFGLDATSTTPLSLTDNGARFSSPYFGLTENATHLGYSTNLGQGMVVRVGAVVQSAQLAGALFGALPRAGGNKLVHTLEMQKSFAGVVGVATLGQLQETDAALGQSGTGALSLQGTARTNFVTLAASSKVTPATTLSAMASFGATSSFANSATSLIDGMSASRSKAWSLGLSQKNVLHDGDQLGLTLAMPLRAMSGTMTVTTASSQSQQDGSLNYATQTVALTPSGMQRDVELSYARPVGQGASLTALAQARIEPGHDASAKTQFAVGVRYVQPF